MSEEGDANVVVLEGADDEESENDAEDFNKSDNLRKTAVQLEARY